MKIQRLKAQNFKSFDRLDLELGDFNVFIGANASGKSNVLNVLRFLRDIAASGLRNAVSLQGDMEFLRNMNVSAEAETIIEVRFSFDTIEERGTVDYVLSIEHDESSSAGYKVGRDHAELCSQHALAEEEDKSKICERLAHEGGRLEWEALPGNERRSIGRLADGNILSQDRALLETPDFNVVSFFQRADVKEILIYDFDTRAQRKAAPVTSKADLEEDGSNVALVLKSIVEDEEKRRRFTNLIQYVLPFVKSVDVERFAGRSLIPTLEEAHAPGTRLPASLLSEGTIKVIALIIALYFEDRPVVAFEEPASNLHPRLISRVVEMMKEQAGQKQIFITTHSPEVIKHAGLENVYLVSRDENGFSQVAKPAEKEEVRIFLANEMGIEDLFAQDLLGI